MKLTFDKHTLSYACLVRKYIVLHNRQKHAVAPQQKRIVLLIEQRALFNRNARCFSNGSIRCFCNRIAFPQLLQFVFRDIDLATLEETESGSQWKRQTGFVCRSTMSCCCGSALRSPSRNARCFAVEAQYTSAAGTLLRFTWKEHLQ